MLVDNYNGKSLTTFGMKVIWRSLSSRWLLSLAFISEVRRLIQVSVCIIFALVSLFGIMSWLPRSFWAVNHRDVQEERENLRRGYSDTLEMYALFQAQHSLSAEPWESEPQHEPVINCDDMQVCEKWTRVGFFVFNWALLFQKERTLESSLSCHLLAP